MCCSVCCAAIRPPSLTYIKLHTAAAGAHRPTEPSTLCDAASVAYTEVILPLANIGADSIGPAGNLPRYPQDNRGKDGILPR